MIFKKPEIEGEIYLVKGPEPLLPYSPMMMMRMMAQITPKMIIIWRREREGRE